VPLHYVRHARGLLRGFAIAAIALVPVAALAAVQYKIEPLRERLQAKAEQQQAEAKLLPDIGRVYGLENKVFQKFVQPLISRQRADQAANSVDPLASKEVDALQKRIKQTADILDSAGPFHDLTVLEAIETAQQYVKAAKQFYDSFKRLVDGQLNWNGQAHERFTREYTELVARRHHLEGLIHFARP
jgi:hypothetical protein